jgi:hypothetical protein
VQHPQINCRAALPRKTHICRITPSAAGNKTKDVKRVAYVLKVLVPTRGPSGCGIVGIHCRKTLAAIFSPCAKRHFPSED